MIRPILAAVAAFVLNAVLVLATDQVMGMLAPDLFSDPSNPSTAGMLIGLGYGTVFAVVAGYVAAMASGGAAQMAVRILAGLITAFAVVTYVQYSAILPAWYSIGLAVLGVTGVLLGGRIFESGQAG